jgi:16S rRNA processing protein RimM
VKVTTSADRIRVVLAKLGRAHGIKGRVRAKVYNPDTELLEPGCVVRITPPDAQDPGAFIECSIEACQRGADDWILKLAGVDDRNSAEQLTGAELWVPREALPALEEGEFYLVDAPGYAVVDDTGAPIGIVSRIETYPTADVLVVEREDAKGSLEVPVVDGIVVGVDHGAKRFVVAREAIDALLE